MDAAYLQEASTNERHEGWNSSSSSIHIAKADSKNHMRPKLFDFNLAIRKKIKLNLKNLNGCIIFARVHQLTTSRVGIQALVAFTLIRHIPKTM